MGLQDNAAAGTDLSQILCFVKPEPFNHVPLIARADQAMS